MGKHADAADFPARWIVHWPGKSTPACDEHKRGLENLGAFMGLTNLQSTEAPAGAQCESCRNKAGGAE